ncbi:hypothetical protein JH06_3555 [Blastocystis sp. subtype 4]|uniref:hypothetical protein n=1 Tax=Blastocystis sp. subtype 4 TaxID=944170 RepID=UPI000711C92F|nr:hypothetical protein JH06_3555 [Blastocystis sp. subtype 4]KNB44503.1 hypothetical protein JH06_3555 [Blastocystis sp. subtype 4]|eukprot:XP_014527946.1 hypothetical protein JH06_3555 [Blastocystis sp. subtype 4]
MGSGGKTKGKRQAHSSKREWKRLRAIKNRMKDLDQIQDELKLDPEKRVIPYDEDLPGGGQFYCLYCDKYFITKDILDKHTQSKIHKKNVKKANEEQYTQQEAELGAGRTKEVYTPINRDTSSQ